MDDASVDNDLEIVDFRRGLTPTQKERIVPVDTVSSELIDAARKTFRCSAQETDGTIEALQAMPDACTVYEYKDFDGRKRHP